MSMLNLENVDCDFIIETRQNAPDLNVDLICFLLPVYHLQKGIDIMPPWLAHLMLLHSNKLGCCQNANNEWKTCFISRDWEIGQEWWCDLRCLDHINLLYSLACWVSLARPSSHKKTSHPEMEIVKLRQRSDLFHTGERKSNCLQAL